MCARWWLPTVAAITVAGCESASPARSVSASRLSPTVVPALTAPRSAGALLFARVTIKDRPYLFAIDTGAGRSLIDAGLARTLKLRSTGRSRETPTLGCETSVRPVRVSDWQLGVRRLPSMTIAAQAAGPTASVDGMRLVGLLGADVLSRFGTLTLDYAHRRIILGGAVPTRGHVVPISVVRRQGNELIAINARIHGKPSRFFLDTGSSTMVISARQAAALKLPVTGNSGSASGAGGCAATVTPIRITRWQIGAVHLPTTPGVSSASHLVAEPEPGQAVTGLLGANVLSSFGTATIDFSRHRLTLGGDPPPMAGRAN